MNDDRAIDMAWLATGLLLVGSSLVARRMPIKRAVAMLLAWVGILVIVMLIVGIFREAGARAGLGRITSLFGDDEQRVTGSSVRLRMAPDGHFWADATINGVRRRMLIDSGATTTSLCMATAKAAGLDLEQSPFPVTLETANGTVIARSSSVSDLQLGPIHAQDLRVVVAPAFGDVDILGMNFLSRLGSWRVENQMLVLEPKA